MSTLASRAAVSLWPHAVLAMCVRCAALTYGEWHDARLSTGDVAYTDVDYHVFSDAALLVSAGRSPYDRPTYRYSPLLAWMLSLAATACGRPSVCGKLVFCAFDVLVGWLVARLCAVLRHNRRTCVAAAAAWWYNPLTVGVSSRGNAESLVVALVLASLWCVVARPRWSIAAGVLLGAAAHLKLYPLVLAPTLYWHLSDGVGKVSELASQPVLLWRRWLRPSRERLCFAVGMSVGLAGLTLLSWLTYGDEFIQHALLYHVTRRDGRHNFSPFFYAFYLLADDGQWLSLAAFVPQAVTVAALSVKFSRRAGVRGLVFAAFSQLFAFVTFNKVCTSQYLLWYWSLVPVVAPSMLMSRREAAALLCVWFLAQAAWLAPAYQLEFEGRPVFRLVWAESVAFFCANVAILARMVRKFSPSDQVST